MDIHIVANIIYPIQCYINYLYIIQTINTKQLIIKRYILNINNDILGLRRRDMKRPSNHLQMILLVSTGVIGKLLDIDEVGVIK